jgi:DNA modification methylase
MPDSVKDRFTVDFEYVFFLVKSKKYFFNKQYEPVTGNTHSKGTGKSVRVPAGWDTGPGNHNKKIGRYIKNKESFTKSTSKVLNKRNKRSVWKIPTQANPSAHFATYPEKLCVTPILAGCPEGGIVLDPFFGSGTTGLVANKLGRRFIGIELNPEYVKIASDRLSQLSIF